MAKRKAQKKNHKRSWGKEIDTLFRRKAGFHKDKRDKRDKRNSQWRKDYNFD